MIPVIPLGHPRLSQQQDLALLVALQRLQLGSTDSSGPDLADSDTEDEAVEQNGNSKVKEEIDRTANRSARLPGHLSTFM
jgi:hypothetical protein